MAAHGIGVAVMKCGMCGYEFDPAAAEIACGGCPLVKGCHLVRCPRCGYEMPPEAVLVRWVRMVRKEGKMSRILSRMAKIIRTRINTDFK